MNENIIDKVQKLLALAGNNPNEAEAQAAMLKAQQLMAKYHIEASQVEDKKVEKEVKTVYVQGHQNTAWALSLAHIVTDNFRCSLLRDPSYGLVFIGLQEDVAIAKGVYLFAVNTLDRNMKKLRRQYRKAGKPTEGISQDYAIGFLTGLKAKYQEQVDRNNWSLVLVKDALVVQKFESLKHPDKKEYQAHVKAGSGDPGLFAKGYHDGKTLGDDQKQLKKAV